jgi:CRP-like cAMP-binding protein
MLKFYYCQAPPEGKPSVDAMTTEGLFSILAAIHPLSPAFKKALEKVLIPLTLPKNHLLLQAPKVADHAYFLNKGFAMAYTFMDGERNVEAFWKTGQIMMSCNSFFEQVPSMEYIQLVKKSELLCISYTSVQDLFDSVPEANHIFRILMIRHYEHFRTRLHDVVRLPARKRFEKLLVNFPEIEQMVAQDAIASYLGITPQSMSRMKRKSGRS